MNKVLNLCVLGGDLRHVHLARLLAVEGHRVHTYALDLSAVPSSNLVQKADLTSLHQADAVLFPMPVSTDGFTLFTPLSSFSVPLTQILDALTAEQFLCGGRLDNQVLSLFCQRKLSISDYFAREELILSNCVPTAEGAIQLAMEHLPITIHGSRVLVLGCGRLGKITSERFAALGADVTVAARRQEHLAWAQCHRFRSEFVGQLSNHLSGYDLIINTVPALILGPDQLSELTPNCLIIDLASNPGGIDFDAAKSLGLSAIHALALPGKVAPVTAGAIIKETICHMLEEHGF